jgi:hypothetical protein
LSLQSRHSGQCANERRDHRRVVVKEI